MRREGYTLTEGRGVMFYLSLRLMALYYPVGMRENLLATGGGEISLPHMLWKRTFRRPGEPSFTLEALGLFRVTLVPCQQGQ